LFAKTAGVVPTLQSALARFSSITWAFVYGSIARNDEAAQSDIDLMIIGSVTAARLVPNTAAPGAAFQSGDQPHALL
jgi:predicted nucleotidyltransferase